MKISFGKIEICAEKELAKNFSVSLKKRLQSDDIIDAQSPILCDKGNARYTISFGIERAHKSPDLAEIFAFEFLKNISEEAQADLKISWAKNLKKQNLIFKNAVLVRSSSSLDESISMHNFEFLAGKGE